MKVLALGLAITLAIAAQISLPRRGRKQQGGNSNDQPKVLPVFAGTLKRLDAKSVVLEMDDYRLLDFHRTDKTQFYKDAEIVKADIFKPGDHVTIEGSEDVDATLTAVNVYLEKPGKAQPDASANPTEAQIAAAEKAQDEAKAKSQGTQVKPPPAPADPDDPGPPKLKHGQTARKASPEIEEPAAQPASAPQPAPNSVPLPGVAPRPTAVPSTRPSDMPVERLDDSLPQRHEDALVRKASLAALDFTETLPAYFCKENITRYHSEVTPVSWQPIDIVTAAVIYDKGKEEYRDLTINGKPVKEKMEEIKGSWSTGEFGTILIDLFSPATAADFRYRRESRVAGLSARLYNFDVDRENSHWTIRSGSQTYVPAYTGSVWIDPQNGRVLRIEMQARKLPNEFPLDKVESSTDYEYVRLGGTVQFLLPVHAETLSCQRGTAMCSRNAIDFRNYHKYSGESTIQFEQPKK